MAATSKMRNGFYGAVMFDCVCFISYVMCSTLSLTATVEATTIKSDQFYFCLQNCANCVQFWEHGLYNGRRCATHCLRLQGKEIVDPDCNNPKMFNYSPKIIDLLLEAQQNRQQISPRLPEEETNNNDKTLSNHSAATKTNHGKTHNSNHKENHHHHKHKNNKHKSSPQRSNR
ncbi:hypothetical protein CHUAL_001788 [Chamberlinius hualienensis]